MMVATIGVFDGVHEGHRYVLSQVNRLAGERGGQSCVFTFANHPASLFSPSATPPMLLTPQEKERRLREQGVGKVVMLQFNKELASLSAADFLRFMAQEHGVTTLLLGYDNHFGRKERTEDGTVLQRSFQDYVLLGEQNGVEIRQLEMFQSSEESAPTSSSLIRRLLLDGNIQEANRCLGYCYEIEGTVVSGKKIGRTLGFPTANINVPDGKLVPSKGVYAARAYIIKEEGACAEARPAVVNIGLCPTFSGSQPTIEAHIIGFSGDIYGKTLRLEFFRRLREERKFASETLLAAQIERDKQEALKCLISKWSKLVLY